MSILMEVPWSESNIARPAETTEEWTAVHGGGFVKGPWRPKHGPKHGPKWPRVGLASLSGMSLTSPIRKPRKKVEYWIDHCENTACTFPFGHDGLCSHLWVCDRLRRSTHHP